MSEVPSTNLVGRQFGIRLRRASFCVHSDQLSTYVAEIITGSTSPFFSPSNDKGFRFSALGPAGLA